MASFDTASAVRSLPELQLTMVFYSDSPVGDRVIDTELSSTTKPLLDLFHSLCMIRKVQSIEVTLQIFSFFLPARRYQSIHKNIYQLSMLVGDLCKLSLIACIQKNKQSRIYTTKAHAVRQASFMRSPQFQRRISFETATAE